VEQVPNKSIKIQPADGSIFVYNIEEIEKMTKEQSTNSQSSSNSFAKTSGYGL
jgi:nitrogen regulatory protein PII